MDNSQYSRLINTIRLAATLRGRARSGNLLVFLYPFSTCIHGVGILPISPDSQMGREFAHSRVGIRKLLARRDPKKRAVAMVLDKEVNQDRKPTNSLNNIVYFLIAYNDHVELSLLKYITLISKKYV